MTDSDKKFLALMPKLNSRRVDVLLEDVLGKRTNPYDAAEGVLKRVKF